MDYHTVDGKGRPIIITGHRCDPRSDQQCQECAQRQLDAERAAENEPVVYPLRASPYYGGDLVFVVTPDEHGDPDIVLRWIPYEGGQVEIELRRPRVPEGVGAHMGTPGEFEADFDEARIMRDALTLIMDRWPTWPRG